ncbi:MAG TPA: hypothetical protein VMB52_07185 [Verrucomicrobiae bacterium]|nr:hypothetical protein [Verrucomicrobiae bacterium]
MEIHNPEGAIQPVDTTNTAPLQGDAPYPSDDGENAAALYEARRSAKVGPRMLAEATTDAQREKQIEAWDRLLAREHMPAELPQGALFDPTEVDVVRDLGVQTYEPSLLNKSSFEEDVTGRLDFVRRFGVLGELRRSIIIERFGLDGRKPTSNEEVGKKYGYGKQRVAQFLTDATIDLGLLGDNDATQKHDQMAYAVPFEAILDDIASKVPEFDAEDRRPYALRLQEVIYEENKLWSHARREELNRNLQASEKNHLQLARLAKPVGTRVIEQDGSPVTQNAYEENTLEAFSLVQLLRATTDVERQLLTLREQVATTPGSANETIIRALDMRLSAVAHHKDDLLRSINLSKNKAHFHPKSVYFTTDQISGVAKDSE